MRIPASNSKGFSLIELLVAIVFIAISMLALATSITVSMRTNLDNDLRNTAIMLTNQTAEALIAVSKDDSLVAMVKKYTRIAGDATQDKVGLPNPEQNIRGASKTFKIEWEVGAGSAVRPITITIQYDHRGQTFSNTSVIYKRYD